MEMTGEQLIHASQAETWAALNNPEILKDCVPGCETIELTGDNHAGVYIPPGVAHGFAAVTDMVITYLVDGYYNPADELGVAWDDPAVAAEWTISEPILSDRDRANPRRADIPAGRRPYWPMRT